MSTMIYTLIDGNGTTHAKHDLDKSEAIRAAQELADQTRDIVEVWFGDERGPFRYFTCDVEPHG